MNNHEQVDLADGNELIPPEGEDIRTEGVKVWHVEKENQENHNGI